MSLFHSTNSLFNTIIKNTFSNTMFHIILIILDYLFTIYPYIISTPYKLYSNFFNDIYTSSPLESSLAIVNKVKLLTTNQTNDDYSSIYLLLIIISLILFLILFYLILLFHNSNNKSMKVLSKVIVNIYNLFVFRYFSFCFIDAIIYYFLLLIHVNNTYYKSILSVLLLGIQCIYLATVFWYINNFTIYIYVSNKRIVPYSIKYPFDYHSLIYEKFTFVMKLLIAYDSNYIILNGYRMSQVNIFLNICVFSITFIAIIAYIIDELYGKDQALVMFTNRKLNAIRKILLLITVISIIIGIIFHPRKNINEELLVSFVSLVIAIALFFMISKYTRRQTFYIRWKDNLEGIILLLMTKNISNTSFTQENFMKTDNGVKSTTGDKSSNAYSQGDESENKKRIYTKIAKRLKVYHYIYCQNHSTCKVCSKKSVINNTLISRETEDEWYSELYYLYKESKIVMNVYDGGNSNNAKHNSRKYQFYLIKLFLSKINQKTFFFFKYFYTLTEDKFINSPTLLKNNLHFLFSNEEVIEDLGTHVFLQEMLTLSKFNVHLKNLLVNFLSFINQEQNLKTADQLLHLSKNITSMKNELEHIIKLLDDKQFGFNGNGANNNNNNSSKDPSLTKDQATKNIQSSCKYNLTLSRYILETLINRSFNSLNPLNIELYEDYLTMHFHFDKVMILSTYIKGNIKRGNRCIFDTIKITGFSSNSNIVSSNIFGTTNGLPKGFYTILPGNINQQGMNVGIEENANQEEEYSQFTFSELFPKNLQELAEIRLHELVANYKGNDIGIFEFVIENHKYLQYIKYIFSLSNTLIDDKLMIYGYFTSPYERILLIKYNNIFYDQEEMYYHGEIVNYSNIIGHIFIIKPYLYEIVKNNLNKMIVLSDIFITINFCGSKEIICELNYEYLNKTCFPLFDKLLQIKASTNELVDTLEMDIAKMKEVIKERLKKTLYMRLTKIIEIDSSYVVYNVSFYNKNGKLPNTLIKNNQQMNSRNAKRIQTRENNRSFFDDENKTMMNENNIMRDFNMQTISSLSITENTLSDHVSGLQNNHRNSQKENSPANIIIQKETKKLEIVSLVTLIINLCLICLCFIFLIMQILKTNEIKNVNDLNLLFKTLRLIFTNIVSSISKSICIVPSITNDTCTNFYSEYISYYQQNIINFTKYDINDYLLYELTRKADYFKNTYSDFKKQLYNLGSSDFLNILNTEVVYISFEQKLNQIVQRTVTDIFGNAIITYINSILVLVGEKENNEINDFRNENIYILTLHDNSINFENIINQHLSQLQHELYKIFSNFINFFVAFNDGERFIDNKVKSLRNETIIISYIFMIALIIFNILLTFMNIENFHIANTLFCKMIGNVFLRLDGNDLKEYLNKKLDHLITLSDLYAKSPIQIIKKITFEQTAFSKIYFQKKKNAAKYNHNLNGSTSNNLSTTPFSNSLSLFQENDKEELTNLNSTNNLLNKNNKALSLQINSFQMKVFFNKTVVPLQNRNFFVSVIYFVIIIICDVILVCYYYDVFQYQDFVMCNLNFELYLYDSIAISPLYRLLNMSDHHMMNVLDEASDEDGMVNKFLKTTFSFYQDVLNYQKISPFSEINDYLPLNCKQLYIKANDSYTYGYYQLKGLNFGEDESFEEMFCEDNNLMKKSLFFPMENYILMLINIHNEHKGEDYESLMRYFNDDDLYKSYMILDFYIRIVREHLTFHVIMPKLKSKFQFYLKYVWIYLILNIVMETSLFILNNLLVKKQLEHIKADLILFDNCVR